MMAFDGFNFVTKTCASVLNRFFVPDTVGPNKFVIPRLRCAPVLMNVGFRTYGARSARFRYPALPGWAEVWCRPAGPGLQTPLSHRHSIVNLPQAKQLPGMTNWIPPIGSGATDWCRCMRLRVQAVGSFVAVGCRVFTLRFV
jgi:hypothetical protein